MTTTDTGTPTRDAVRAALVDLLTTGQHHHAATPTTLTTIGQTRRALAQQHGTTDPAARCAPPERRLAALTTALGVVGGALFTATPWRPLDTARQRTGLAELAAVALGWLDALPPPDPPDTGPDDEPPF